MTMRLMDAQLAHARAHQRFRRAVARRLDMTETDVDALLWVLRAGHTTPGQFTAELGLTTGGTTALVQRLEERGFLRRTPHPTDRRSWVLAATGKAAVALRDCYRPLAEALAALAETHPAESAAVADYLTEAARLTEQAVDAVLRESAPPQPGSATAPRGLWQ